MFSHLFKLDIQGLKLINHNIQVLFGMEPFPFPSPFLSCPAYSNDKNTWGGREIPS